MPSITVTANKQLSTNIAKANKTPFIDELLLTTRWLSH